MDLMRVGGRWHLQDQRPELLQNRLIINYSNVRIHLVPEFNLLQIIPQNITFNKVSLPSLVSSFIQMSPNFLSLKENQNQQNKFIT